MKWLFLLVSVFVTGCNSGRKAGPDVVTDVFSASAVDTVTPYFAMGDAWMSRFYEVEVGSILRCLHEPVLHNYGGKGACIRLTWLRPFDNPVVIRLNSYKDTCYIVIKELAAKRFEGDSGTIIKDTSFYVDNTLWQNAVIGLESQRFFSALTQDKAAMQEKDGVLWLLECRLHDKYNCVEGADGGELTNQFLQQYAAPLLEVAGRVITLKSRS